jgi:hypothetical protein
VQLFADCQLTAKEREHGYFQQDSATAHMANAIIIAVWDMFED